MVRATLKPAVTPIKKIVKALAANSSATAVEATNSEKAPFLLLIQGLASVVSIPMVRATLTPAATTIKKIVRAPRVSSSATAVEATSGETPVLLLRHLRLPTRHLFLWIQHLLQPALLFQPLAASVLKILQFLVTPTPNAL
jgi:hypothetical protein